MLPRCDTSSSPVLHNARTIQFHQVHSSSFPTGRPATGLCTQPLTDRKDSLTPITLKLASVCGGNLVTVNQFLPRYRLSAPRSLSYYSAAVCSSACPVWTGTAWPHGYVVTIPTTLLSPPPPSVYPFLCHKSVWRRSSATGVSNFLLLHSLSILFPVDESLNSLFLRCYTASRALTVSLPNTRWPRLFSFCVVESLVQSLHTDHACQTILYSSFPSFSFTHLSSSLAVRSKLNLIKKLQPGESD